MDWGDSVHLGELVGCGGREERWWPLKSVEALGQVALVPQPRRAFSHYFTLMLIDILSRYTLGLILTDDYWMRVAEKCYICIFKKLLLRKWMEPPSNYSYKNLGHKENLKYSSLFGWKKKKKDVSWMVMPGLGFPSGLVVKKKKICLPVQETQVRSLGQKIPLEKEMATHSSILAWRIPWTGEPGELQCVGSQRVRYDWACTRVCAYTYTHIC